MCFITTYLICHKLQGIGDIQFQIALSEGVATVGPRYKAVSVRASISNSTWLTARREGHREILDGQRILNDINDEVKKLFLQFKMVHFKTLQKLAVDFEVLLSVRLVKQT